MRKGYIVSMGEIKFRVWCEFEFEGKIETSMESPASWFLLSQTGKLWDCEPLVAPRPLGKEYIKAIPLFFTGFKDKDEKEIYKGDLIQNFYGRICEVVWDGAFGRWDAVVRKTARNDNASGFKPEDWQRGVRVVGNKYENLELLESG